MSRLPPRLAAAAAAALLAWPGAGAFAATQLFKCMDGGRTVYQQQACSVSSQPEAASAPRTTATASAPADAASAAPRKVRSSLPASAALATPR